MNRKRLNIFLIPMTILLWIVIFIRIVSLTGPQKVDEINKMPGQTQNKESNTLDTLSLLLNYQDPFNTKRFTPNNTVSKGIVQKKSSKSFFERKVEPPLPSVAFLGTINSGEYSKNVALLVVKGKTVLVSPNDTIGGFKVVNCWRDSVRLTFDKRTITVKH